MAESYLTKDGLLYVWQKLKTLFASKDEAMTSAEKTKLSGIATGAEVNQNAFGNVKVGNAAIAADAKTDTLTLASGTGIALTADTTNDKVTIEVSGLTGDNVIYEDNVTINDIIDDLAPLMSPDFTGNPTAPTQAAGNNSTRIATTAFVNTAITNAIAGVQGIQYSVVASLPATGAVGTIYLVSNSGSGQNVYDEYIWVNSTFEKIGTTDVDLSGYLQTTDVIAITNAEIDTILAS